MGPTQEPAFSAFISYASADSERAQEICQSLEERGFKCWIAPRDVRSGRDYGEEIIHGIARSRCLVLVLSEAANASTFVKREVERAVSRRKPVFPIRIEEVLPSPALELFVSTTHWIDAWSGNLTDHVGRLARDLSDEDMLKEGADRSRQIARRRQMPRWIAAGIGFAGIVGAIVLGNMLSGRVGGSSPQQAAVTEPDGGAALADAGPAEPALDLDAAMDRLDRAIAAADVTNRGQVEALETLLDAGHSYAGGSLRGIHLVDADLAGHSFAETELTGSDLSGAQLQESTLQGARLHFCHAEGLQAAGAKAQRMRGFFLVGEASSWSGADCRQASFFGGRLAGADFSGADLRGADLSFCDLRNANFENAKLEGTFFIGSVLTGARFGGASFGRTDVTGAAIEIDKLSEAQRSGIGRTEGAGPGGYHTVQVDIIEEIPTSRFSGGIEYRPLIERPWSLPGFGPTALPLCARRELVPLQTWPILQYDAVERLSDQIGLGFEQSFLQIAGRRSKFLARVREQEAFLAEALGSRDPQ